MFFVRGKRPEVLLCRDSGGLLGGLSSDGATAAMGMIGCLGSSPGSGAMSGGAGLCWCGGDTMAFSSIQDLFMLKLQDDY